MGLRESVRKGINDKLKDDIAFIAIEDSISDVDTFVSTGCTELDIKCANGPNGGIPITKITEITGQEGTGKSLMAMHIMANAQKMGGLAVYIDPEHGLNTDFARQIGLTVEDIIHVLPTSMEDVFITVNEICQHLEEEQVAAKKEKRDPEHKFVVVVWDSIAATPTKHDRDGENPDPSSSIGVKARILSKNIPMWLNYASKYKIGFVLVNQLRTMIGAMPGQDPWVSPGGKAVPFYSSLRIRLSSIGKLKNKDKTVVGIKTRAKIVKNRFGPPHRIAQFPIYFTHGIDDEESLMEALTGNGLVKSSGGRNGSMFHIKGDSKDTATKQFDFKLKMYTDQEFREKIKNVAYQNLVIAMTDPRMEELELSRDGDDDKGDEDE